MAVLRSVEIAEMSEAEISDRMQQLQADLMKIRGVLSSGGVPEDIGKAREIRRSIARLKTISHQKAKQSLKEKGSVKAEKNAAAKEKIKSKK